MLVLYPEYAVIFHAQIPSSIFLSSDPTSSAVGLRALFAWCCNMSVLSLNLDKDKLLPKGKTTGVATKLLGAIKYAVGTSQVTPSSTLAPGPWETSNLAHLSIPGVSVPTAGHACSWEQDSHQFLCCLCVCNVNVAHMLYIGIV